jgi:hypothetical protein
MSERTIPILVDVPSEAPSDTKAWWNSETLIELRQIPVDKLRANLTTICNSLLTLVQDIKAVGHFKLHEMTVQVEVSADGGINFIGTAKLAGKGAITLKFQDHE